MTGPLRGLGPSGTPNAILGQPTEGEGNLMRRFPMRVPLLIMTLMTCLHPSSVRSETPPIVEAADSIFIRMTQGVVGGIVPAHVRMQLVVVPAPHGHTVAFVDRSSAGTGPAFFIGRDTDGRTASILREMETIGLWSLPVESPPGSADVYGMDTSLIVATPNRAWGNLGPGACMHGISDTRPTDDQVELFRRCVTALHGLRETATNATDEGGYNAVLRTFEEWFTVARITVTQEK